VRLNVCAKSVDVIAQASCHLAECLHAPLSLVDHHVNLATVGSMSLEILLVLPAYGKSIIERPPQVVNFCLVRTLKRRHARVDDSGTKTNLT
jgi:hypothetical protein